MNQTVIDKQKERITVTIPQSTIDKMKHIIDESDVLQLEIGATLVIDEDNNIDLVHPNIGTYGGVSSHSSINRTNLTLAANQKIIGRFHTHPQDSAVPSYGDIDNVLFDDDEMYYINCIGSNYLDHRMPDSKEDTPRKQHIMCFSIKRPVTFIKDTFPDSELINEQMYGGNFVEFNKYFDNITIHIDSIHDGIEYEMEEGRPQRMMKRYYKGVKELRKMGKL